MQDGSPVRILTLYDQIYTKVSTRPKFSSGISFHPRRLEAAQASDSLKNHKLKWDEINLCCSDLEQTRDLSTCFSPCLQVTGICAAVPLYRYAAVPLCCRAAIL